MKMNTKANIIRIVGLISRHLYAIGGNFYIKMKIITVSLI